MIDEKTSKSMLKIFMNWLCDDFEKRKKEVEVKMETVSEALQLLRDYHVHPVAIRRLWTAEEKARRDALDEEANMHAEYLACKHRHLCFLHASYNRFKFIQETAEKLSEMMKFY